jgi:hypothetical protein
MLDERVRIGKAAKMLGVTVQTLRNWDKSGKLPASKSRRGQRYYQRDDLQRFRLDLKALAWVWASSAQPPLISDDYYSERQDRFTSRLVKMSTVLLGANPAATDLVSLLTLVAGEIGDNSFAHNVGNWPDVPGVFFAYDVHKRLIVLADRGRGVRATLQRIRPELVDDIAALQVAFTEIISGRDPERRGNGLKVVRRVVESNPIKLVFRSGLAIVEFTNNADAMRVSMAEQNVRGTYAVISF